MELRKSMSLENEFEFEVVQSEDKSSGSMNVGISPSFNRPNPAAVEENK